MLVQLFQISLANTFIPRAQSVPVALMNPLIFLQHQSPAS
jgi:hypothetical protein